MKTQELETTARALVAAGKGILAADESSPTIEKRFNRINVPSTEENRRAYRGQSQDGVKGMKTNKPQKRHVGKKRKANTIANAAVGAVVGGVIAGPVGAIAGAAVGAMLEKGPAKSPPRRQPTAARPTADQPSSSGKHRPPASRKKPAGKASRRKPRTTIAPPLAGAGPDVRINRAKRK